MSYDPDFEFKNNRHFRTRATGQIYMGPIQQVGYDQRVLQLTVNELQFDSSVEAQRFMDLQRKKYAPTNTLCKSRKLKMLSRYDDR